MATTNSGNSTLSTMRPGGIAPAPGTNPQTTSGGSGTKGNMTPAQKGMFGSIGGGKGK